MLGWKRRFFFFTTPWFLPQSIYVEGHERCAGKGRLLVPLFCALLAFSLAVGARLLELPYWDNPAYRLGNEFLLATHDAYHWIAGAEGFEFGVGHPMSELVRLLAAWTGMLPANMGFWLPPFMGGLLAVSVFLWGWGLGYPLGGLAAGVLAALSPGFCARTLLGFYDTDLVVLLFAVLLGLVPALWLTPWLATLPDIAVGWFPSGRALLERWAGNGSARRSAPFVQGIAGTEAQEIAAKPPVARWFFGEAAERAGEAAFTPWEMRRDMLRWPWLLLLVFSGLFGHWMQDWHSLFPYLVRFSALVSPVLILVLGPVGGRKFLLRGALCHSLPLLLGWPGAVAALAYAALLILIPPDKDALEGGPGKDRNVTGMLKLFRGLHSAEVQDFCRRFLWGNASQYALWFLVVLLCFDATVLANMSNSFFSYVNRGGDVAPATSAVSDPLVFPSVAQSIIEVQTINLRELLIYTYPIETVTLLCIFAFACRVIVTPAFIWFIPLFMLSFLSVSMGGRMTMFGPPVLMLALCIEGGLLLEVVFFRLLFPMLSGRRANKGPSGFAILLSPMAAAFGGWGKAVRLMACLTCTTLLAWPLITLLPEYTQGPIISREQAQALEFIKKNTPPESIVWDWWDWGYATHHFAQRRAIADGARHGGPSLYLPAAVYTTADPRFARQVIKYTASKGNIPGNVFEGLSGAEAQQLMRELGNREKPLIDAPGRQYVVVSFELLRLGLWVTRYGSWNFVTKDAPGALMSNLSDALEFNMETGAIAPKNGQTVYAGSIDIFGSQGLERRNYNRFGAYHFIFNPQTKEQAQLAQRKLGLLERFWQWQHGYFSFTALSNDKMVVDPVYYNTMMVQLLLSPGDDPRITPYFKLVFDNVYTRVYEVL